jgi:S-adenosylmethionine:diacylglycerol 3-amino-3-carboxypropyl transferase/ubiquinone/menaquinone biosynthesis C-methylase UbiE
MAKEPRSEARTRRKLVNAELNPVADFILSMVIISMTPLFWIFGKIHDKIMFMFLGKTYIYNVSWEDPRMDQRVFNLGPDDHVITIASAGCNVLDYIIEGAKVTAVDFNSCQIALTELKKVAIMHLDFPQFFAIFGMSDMELLRRVYPNKLRPYMSPVSVEFWDDGVHRIRSFMYSGTSGNMSWVLFRVLFPIFGLGFLRRDIMNGISPEELKKKVAKCEYGLRSMAWLMDNILLRGGCVLAGVPERQMNLGIHRHSNLGMVIERVFFQTDLVFDNYFYAGYILGHYKPDNCPRYLREENFDKMKKHLKEGKLHLVHGTILSAIEDLDTPITVASLLDHMDWMTDHAINEEITALISKMDPVRGKIFWRTFADEVHCATLKWLNPVKVDDSDDRVGMYWSTWIADIKNADVAYERREDTKVEKGLISNLWTGAKMVTFPFWKPLVASSLKATGHAKEMESFYKYQKEGYDAFREGLLHARPVLMEAFPLHKNGGIVWIDVGGGTARNLEYFSVSVIRKYFKHIYILDVSSSLLEMAQRRIDTMGVSDIVTVVEHDFTADSVFSVLPKAGTVDVITMSYSFSMIPKQEDAVKNAIKLLRPKGHLAIADFFLHGRHDDALPDFQRVVRKLESKFHKWWFEQDHVHLLGAKQIRMGSPALEIVYDERFRGGVPFLPFLVPYHGVLIQQKK